MSKAYKPKHLNAQQLTSLYGQALVEAEANVVKAWINVCKYQSPQAKEIHEVEEQALANLEAEIERMQKLTAPVELEEEAVNEL